MNIVIIGAGAIGSVVAGYLSKAGVNVTLLGRPDHVQAIEKSGLHIKGARGEETFRIKTVTTIDQPYDLTIWTVKTQDIREAFTQNKKYLETGLVLSTQNGVQADRILSEFVEKDRIMSSIVMFGATYAQPGEVTFNFEGDWIIGRAFNICHAPLKAGHPAEKELDSRFRGNDKQLQEIVQVLQKAFSVIISDNIIGMKHLKLFVNFNNCIPAVIGKSIQETFADMDLCRLSILLLKEGVGIVKKAGIELVSMPKFPVERILGLTQMPLEQAAGIINKTLTSLSKEPLYGSILQSILRGRESEIDFINGEVVRIAQEKGWEAPLNKRIVQLVHEVEKGKKFFNLDEIKSKFDLRIEAKA